VGTASNGTLGTVGNITCSNGSATAQVTYSPNVGFNGSDSFSYTAGDVSGATSDPATVTITVESALFRSGFETGNLSEWSSSAGLTVGSATVRSGSFAAEGNTTNGATWAKKTLAATATELTYQIHFRLHSKASTSTIHLLKFRTAADKPIGGVYLDGGRHLVFRNDVTTTNGTASSTVIALDTWYTLTFHAKINGAASAVDATLDGNALPTLSLTGIDLGTNPIGELQLGDTNTAKTYDVFFDDILLLQPGPAANSPPQAGAVSITATAGRAATWTPSVSDADDTTLTCSIASNPNHGSATVASNCSSGTYTANSGFLGGDSFTYRVSDGHASATATVSVTVDNRPPTAVAAAVSTTTGQPVSVPLAANDPDGNCPIGFSVGSAANGTLSTVSNVSCSGGNATAQVTYTPNSGFNGADSFTYTASDPSGAASAAATAAVTVTPPVFADGFESGNFAAWSSATGLSAESSTVATGSFAAEGNATNGTTWAKKTLSKTYPELTYRLRFRLHSRAAGSSVMLLKFRTAADTYIGGVFVDTSGKLEVRNDITAANMPSTIVVALDTWYTLTFHLKVNGTSSVDDVNLNGTPIATLSSAAANFGTAPIAALQLGEPSAAKTYDVFFDDVVVSSP
jgi:Bacterial Ig domain